MLMCRPAFTQKDSYAYTSTQSHEVTVSQQDSPQQEEERKPVIALRSNLLFDAASVVNLGAELPIGRRWSIAADAYFPWWHCRQRDLTLDALAGTLDVKCWLGNRRKHDALTGWSTGLYAGAGYYDVQLFNKNGVQGEMFIMGGASLGYAHRIAKHLRLEYSVGVGYLVSDYRKYNAVTTSEGQYIKVRQYPWEDRRFSGIFPTRLGISLVWLIDKKKGGGRP